MRFSARFLKRIEKRLMAGIRIDEETGCWVWERYIEVGCPARIQINRSFGGEHYTRRRHYQVNYLVYQLVVGELPDEPFHFVKKPTCYYMNRCVNPYHSDVRLITTSKDQRFSTEMRRMRKTFGLNVVIDMHTGCWSYTGPSSGQLISWMLYRGDVPQNANVRVMCQTSGCCNPVHITLHYVPLLVDLVDRLADEPWEGDV
jgi:hypothetical protein